MNYTYRKSAYRMVKHSLLVLWSLQLTSCVKATSQRTPRDSKEKMRRDMDEMKKRDDRTRARMAEALRKNQEEQLKKMAENLREKAAEDQTPEKDQEAYSQIDENQSYPWGDEGGDY